MSFTLYSPSKRQYLGTNLRSHWVDWAKEAREFPSLKEATTYIEAVGWRNSTLADDSMAVYVVELIG